MRHKIEKKMKTTEIIQFSEDQRRLVVLSGFCSLFLSRCWKKELCLWGWRVPEVLLFGGIRGLAVRF